MRHYERLLFVLIGGFAICSLPLPAGLLLVKSVFSFVDLAIVVLGIIVGFYHSSDCTVLAEDSEAYGRVLKVTHAALMSCVYDL